MPTHTCFEKCWMPTVQATEVQQLVYNWVFHVLAEEICATVPQLLSYADYLNQFVKSTEFALPTRSRSPRYTAKIPPFTPGDLDPASAFHLLLKLHNLILVPWLPFAIKSWIQGRISWIEANSDPYSAARLEAMIRKRPCDGFPVSNATGQMPFGGICETIALTPADQRLWFLAHSWLFVGIDWNADYYSEASNS
ncbi:hypothetical protein N0V87_008967 [Didymella glomerata]|uniref:Uncharacterized protein n=1 Tax=Didymella glomerata TaxID=749621 RepID=A0A9W9BWN6_9PLEO|nr:hypothetical protein N0V87_008967 [Didymella glomerata]